MAGGPRKSAWALTRVRRLGQMDGQTTLDRFQAPAHGKSRLRRTEDSISLQTCVPAVGRKTCPPCATQ